MTAIPAKEVTTKLVGAVRFGFYTDEEVRHDTRQAWQAAGSCCMHMQLTCAVLGHQHTGRRTPGCSARALRTGCSPAFNTSERLPSHLSCCCPALTTHPAGEEAEREAHRAAHHL